MSQNTIICHRRTTAHKQTGVHLLRENMSKTVDICETSDALKHSWSHSVPAGLACTAYLALHLRSAALACSGRHRVASVTAEPTSKPILEAWIGHRQDFVLCCEVTHMGTVVGGRKRRVPANVDSQGSHHP